MNERRMKVKQCWNIPFKSLKPGDSSGHLRLRGIPLSTHSIKVVSDGVAIRVHLRMELVVIPNTHLCDHLGEPFILEAQGVDIDA
jgi:hypothetical protein